MLREIGGGRDPDTGEATRLSRAYMHWLDRFAHNILPAYLATAEGRAVLAHLEQLLGRVLRGGQRPIKVRRKTTIVWCGKPCCAAAKAAGERPRHGPYAVEQVWVPGLAGARGSWRSIGRARTVTDDVATQIARGEPEPTAADGELPPAPRAATPDEQKSLRGVVLE